MFDTISTDLLDDVTGGLNSGTTAAFPPKGTLNAWSYNGVQWVQKPGGLPLPRSGVPVRQIVR